MQTISKHKQASRIQPTNITAFDEILNGGIPYGSLVLTTGPAGGGKTTLAQQWLFEGARHSNETGLYISFTEEVDKASRNMEQFDFFDQSFIDTDKIRLLDGRILLKDTPFKQNSSLSMLEMDQLLTIIMNLVDQTQAKRVVIDSITALIYKLEGVDAVRSFIFRLGYALSSPGATVMLIGEADLGSNTKSPVEEYISDAIIYVDSGSGRNQQMRRLEVKKMRGVHYRSGPVFFEITSQGITLYPKIPTYGLTALTDFKTRRKTGIKKLDEMMGGGIPQGHILLVGGNTGSGRSTLGMHFLEEGIKQGEKGLFVSIDESMTQIIKTAREHDWMFEEHLKAKTLISVSSDLIDIYPDKLLYEVVRAVEENDIKRVVIDSISSMESSEFARDYVRDFLLQLTAFFKSRGINCLATYLTTEMFAATSKQLIGGTILSELQLSSIVDGIILLRYVERDQEVRKLLSVLKMRGSDHEKGIYEFSIGKSGLIVGSQFEG
jgi:circadian clock protein KaiC